MNQTTIFLDSIYRHTDYDNKNILKISVMRYRKKGAEGIENFENLSPSKELYKWAMKQKELRTDWWPEYKRKFVEEIESNEKALELLDMLAKSGKKIAIFCACYYYKKCHRFILGEMLEKRGAQVVYK